MESVSMIPQLLSVSPAAASGPLPTSFVLPGVQRPPLEYNSDRAIPSRTMGPWRQGQAGTQDYWPLGLGTLHCPHGLEGVFGCSWKAFSPRGLGHSLPASALQGPKYGPYCWIFANKLLLEK
ncbi:unnamed protein product [Rangifer tarandus platyrhynchus]|uniref:Uncharacterized protein n=2 Tax=Rangifer tarandus platyrhynchus TaxID=3082113 RepID=A0ABN8YXA4_RANTA|nr:unnamed protein product [Rangifer tarandus platyrhynchus]